MLWGLKRSLTFVENDAILDKIWTLRVDYAQGYDIATPLPLMSPQLHRRN